MKTVKQLTKQLEMMGMNTQEAAKLLATLSGVAVSYDALVSAIDTLTTSKVYSAEH